MHIPSLAIHYSRDQNTNFTFDKEKHLKPVISTAIQENETSLPKETLILEMIAKKINKDVNDILSYELTTFDYNVQLFFKIETMFGWTKQRIHLFTRFRQ